MTGFGWSAAVWLGWLALFLVLELLGYWHVTPWSTLSEWTWTLEGAWSPFRFVVLFGLAVLLVHLVSRWP